MATRRWIRSWLGHRHDGKPQGRRPGARRRLEVERLEDRTVPATTALNFDFGPAGSPVATGYLAVGPAMNYAPGRGYGWVAGSNLTGLNQGTGLLQRRDFVQALDETFAVDVRNGTYSVSPIIGDALKSVGPETVYINGRQVGVVTTAAGQYATPTYSVPVSDGQLTVRVVGQTGAPARLNALRVAAAASPLWSTGIVPARPTVTAAYTTGGAVGEGAAATVSFSKVAGGVGPYTYSYGFGNDGAFQIVGSNLATVAVPAQYLADPGARIVRGRVADSLGHSAEFTTTLAVSNLPPVVTPTGTTSTLVLGASTSLALGSFTDPGANDGPWTVTVDWGDNTSSSFTAASQGAISGNHGYAANGIYAVVVRVADKYGSTGSAAGQVVASAGSPPLSATFGNGGAVTEGTAGLVSFIGVTGGSGRYTYSYDFNNDGTFEIAGSGQQATPVPAQYLSTPGGKTVHGRVTDSAGAFADFTTSITVVNVAPTVTPASSGQTVDQGKSTLFTVGSFADAGADDGPWTVTVTWGDGASSTQIVSFQGSLSAAHTYSAAGAVTVGVTVTDKYGAAAVASYQVSVTAASNPLSATFGNAGPVNEGNSGSVSFTNVTGGTGPYTYSYDFNNDGTFEAAGTTQAAATVPAQYLLNPGPQTVRGRVTDRTGAFADFTTSIPVGNAAPAVTPGGSGQTAFRGVPTSFAVGSFADPGTNDGPWTVTVNWGDGSTTTFSTPFQGPMSAVHSYSTAGTYSAAVTVTDKYNGAGSAATIVTATSPTNGTGLANVGLTPGWATVAEALPDGAATGGLQLGGLATQTDVKTRWPDGSIRFATVSAYVPVAGTYTLTPTAAPAAGTFTPTNPNAHVQFNIGGTIYTANLPTTPSSDTWLSGPFVSESRWTVDPAAPDGTLQPYLRVVFDTRCYIDGTSRLDVTVENELDKPGATAVTYSVDIVAGGQTVYHHDTLTHYYLTRWRTVADLGVTESQVTPDFSTFYQADALPRYLSMVTDAVYAPAGPNFDILQPGDLNPYMGAPGASAVVAPYPNWVGNYLVHEDPTLRQYVLANGNLAGSWPVHIENPDGSLISIDQRPNYWFDPRSFPYGDGPVGANHLTDPTAFGPLQPDNAHVPSLAYVPYLLTGERYYADEMQAWANFAILNTWPGMNNADRQGSKGLLVQNQVRGIAWTLRNIADAAAYLPDNAPAKSYLANKLENNLAWLDGLAVSHNTPLGSVFDTQTNSGSPSLLMSPWENNYLAWAIDHANLQGFSGGSSMRDKIVQFQLTLFNSPEWPRDGAAPGWIVVGQRSPDGTNVYYSTLGQAYQATYGNSASPNPFNGYYGVDARLSLMIAIREGLPHAQDSYDYLFQIIGNEPYLYGVSDLAARAGWAIAMDGEP
jgi:hypothetical protein